MSFKNPRFNDDPECYTFAVSILEGKPLFVGDEVYWKRAGKFDWDKWSLPDDKKMCQDMLTRTPPVRTIMLNGEKLPAPNDGCFICILAASIISSTVSKMAKI